MLALRGGHSEFAILEDGAKKIREGGAVRLREASPDAADALVEARLGDARDPVAFVGYIFVMTCASTAPMGGGAALFCRSHARGSEDPGSIAE